MKEIKGNEENNMLFVNLEDFGLLDDSRHGDVLNWLESSPLPAYDLCDTENGIDGDEAKEAQKLYDYLYDNDIEIPSGFETRTVYVALLLGYKAYYLERDEYNYNNILGEYFWKERPVGKDSHFVSGRFADCIRKHGVISQEFRNLLKNVSNDDSDEPLDGDVIVLILNHLLSDYQGEDLFSPCGSFVKCEETDIFEFFDNGEGMERSCRSDRELCVTDGNESGKECCLFHQFKLSDVINRLEWNGGIIGVTEMAYLAGATKVYYENSDDIDTYYYKDI